MNGYVTALFCHVIVVVYLLGADLGRVYLARAGGATTTAPAARLLAVRGTLWLGRVTDLALILVLPAGIALGGASDAYRIDSPAWRMVPWLLPLLLLALSIGSDRAATRPGGGGSLGLADSIARFVIGAGQLWDGLSVLLLNMTHMVEADWLAAKLAIYGLLLLLSIPVRRSSLALRRDVAGLDGNPPDTAMSERLALRLRRVQLPVALGWLLILIMAWLGTAKPG